ncbi:hypothetical protein [Cereibacter azotoformans]|uniref:Uncharacterized protein n=1 Tax=Cereibacter azotoformans TaxID=43057 RepID=A0A2T5K723_9RHOB|nr:hypothetical protein [Cereibacter azotoformans]MBO4169546.1 hypothetical protein [Cereibacter azotoformans]PTR18223.1 hypothetical protein C8J28_109183 [Cereibacter azotoformans]
MRNGNGNILGARRVPTAQAAGGVWGVEDAYLADRDAQWPRWPENVGIPFDGRLRMWLEADYGLYRDADATVPVTANGQSVKSWVNRGNSGRLIHSSGTPPTKTASGLDFATNPGFDALDCDRGRYNYAFAVGTQENNSGRSFISGPASSVPLIRPSSLSGSRYCSVTGPSYTGVLNVSFAGGTALFSSLHGLLLPSTGSVEQVVGSAGVTQVKAGVASYPPQGRALMSVGAGTNRANLAAVIWYSSDEMMSLDEINHVMAYLGTKYGVAYPVFA